VRQPERAKNECSAEGGRSGRCSRRVLMLCYYYPPIRSSGTTRSVEFATRLPRHGWTPTVLTVLDGKEPWSSREETLPLGVEVRRTREFDLHRVVSFFQGATCRVSRVFGVEPQRNYFWEMLCVPDAQIAWQTTIAGVRLARDADVVYASCSPFSSAISACLIKRATGRPVVLDFRDPWSLNTHHRDTALRRRMIERLEQYALKRCNFVILNSEGAAHLYREKYPWARDKVTAIPNGYDAIDLAPPRDARCDGKFTIMHVGQFYGSRQPDRILDALGEIGDPSIEFVQVGPSTARLATEAARLPVRIIPSVPHAEALSLMKSASLLYLVQGRVDGPADVAVAAKTYEYIATGLPVLADCPPGDNADTIERFASKAFVVRSGRMEDVAAAIREARATTRSWAPTVNPEFVRRFDREHLTEELASVLRRAAEGGAGAPGRTGR